MDDGFAGVLKACANPGDKEKGNWSGGKLEKGMLVTDCALIRLTDKAFERQKAKAAETTKHGLAPSIGKEAKWDQNHLGIAFKFASVETEDTRSRWHCVWATLAEYDEDAGTCLFRSYDDVYLNKLERSPRKGRFKRNKSRNPDRF